MGKSDGLKGADDLGLELPTKDHLYLCDMPEGVTISPYFYVEQQFSVKFSLISFDIWAKEDQKGGSRKWQTQP